MNTILGILKRKNGVMTEGTAAEGSFCVPVTKGTAPEGFAIMVPPLFEAMPGLDTYKTRISFAECATSDKTETELRHAKREALCVSKGGASVQSAICCNRQARYNNDSGIPRNIPDCYCSQTVMSWVGVHCLCASCCGALQSYYTIFEIAEASNRKSLKKQKFLQQPTFEISHKKNGKLKKKHARRL
jgi:hypothetical protein